MDFIFWHRLDVLFFSQSQQHQQHFGIRQRLWGSSDGNGTTSSTRSTAFRWLFTTSTTHLWYTSTSASELTERKFQWVLNGVKSEGNQANSRKMYEHLVIVFSLSVLLWDIFLGGAYDQGIIICINLMYQDMGFSFSGERWITCLWPQISKDGSPPSCRRNSPRHQ